MSWQYEDESMTSADLTRAVQSMSEFTGIDRVAVRLPRVTGSLGYASAKLNLTWGQSATDRLITIAKTWSKKSWVSWIMKRFETIVQRDRFAICDASSSGRIESCLDQERGQARAAAKRMWKALQKMKESFGRDPKEFSKAYATWGSAVVNNKFAFWAGVRAAGDQVEIDFSIEGTRVSQYNLHMNSVDRDENMFSFRAETENDDYLKASIRRSQYRGLLIGLDPASGTWPACF